jgi:serine/threonine-protein kinase
MWNVRLARRQVRSFANFAHPAVVPFVDVGTAGGLHYLAWPLAEGHSLESVVQHQGKLPVGQAVLYAVQTAQGLTAAHQNNLFHGLVKPSNVLVGSDNQARILDFGIGSLLVENDGESLVDTMSTANTLTSGLDCASPESIMEPTNRTPAGDQYSLGCVLYFALTGRVPFPEGSAVEKMMAHQTKEPAAIRELAPEVAEGLEAVVKKMMAKAPDQRYGGCDEAVEALEPFLGDLSKIAGGVPGLQPAASGYSSASRPGLSGRSNPGSKITLPSRTPTPSPSANGTIPIPPNVRTPEPKSHPPGSRPGAALPNRASFQFPTAPDAAPAGGPKSHPPADPARASMKLPTRGATGGPAMQSAKFPAPQPEPAEGAEPQARAGDDAAEAKPSSFGAVGIVAAALLLMVVVYIAGTMLMK